MSKIPCPSWKPTNAYGGQCAEGEFGGKPTVGDCLLACKKHRTAKMSQARVEAVTVKGTPVRVDKPLRMVGPSYANRPTPPPPPVVIEHGPGTEFEKLGGIFGLNRDCNTCRLLKQRMNVLGVDGCREHFDELVAEIKKRFEDMKIGKLEWAVAAARGIAAGLLFKIKDPLNPVPGLLEEAIRRSTLNGS